MAVAAPRLRQIRNTVVMSGTEVLSILNLQMGTKAGRVLMYQAFNPVVLDGTRLASLAKNFMRWKPISLRLGLVGAAPTTTPGQLAMCWVADPRERLPTGELAMVRKVGAISPRVISHLWENKWLIINRQPIQKWLYTNPKEEDAFHGAFLVVCMAGLSGGTGVVQTTLQLDWKICFDGSDVNAEDDETQLVNADEGYYPYFTTYSSHLPQTDRLTVMNGTQGGYAEICRFSLAEPDLVYVPVKSDALKYYDTQGQEKNVAAIVRMKEVPDPLMWCFATTADATKYVQKGDISNVIKYYKGGEWAVGNPLFKPKALEATLNLANPTYSVNISDDRLEKAANSTLFHTRRVDAAVNSTLSCWLSGPDPLPVVVAGRLDAESEADSFAVVEPDEDAPPPTAALDEQIRSLQDQLVALMQEREALPERRLPIIG